MTLETFLTYALYFFALNYLVMFGAFFLFNDWALRFLFRYPLRSVLANSPSKDTLRWTSIGMIFHRMEASFGLGIAVLVGSMTYFSAGNLKLLSVLSGGVAAHAIFVALNHTLSHAGRAKFCQQQHLPPQVHTTLGVLRFAAAFMALAYGLLAVYGLSNG
jgi:hypothetical protein